MSSPVFDAMFTGKMTTFLASSGKLEPIALPDLIPSCFKDLLQ